MKVTNELGLPQAFINALNLEKHIENLQQYGVPVVVTLNSFITDTDAENNFVKEFCESRGCKFAIAKVS